MFTNNKIIGIIIGAITLTILSFMVGRYFVQPKKLANTPNSPKEEAVFREQNAVIDGKITKIEGNMLTVESKTGASGNFSLSPQAVIYKTMNNQQVATPSSGVSSVDLNKPAFIFLKLISSQYQITTINYIAAQARSEPLPPPPDQPLKTKSSK